MSSLECRLWRRTVSTRLSLGMLMWIAQSRCCPLSPLSSYWVVVVGFFLPSLETPQCSVGRRLESMQMWTSSASLPALSAHRWKLGCENSGFPASAPSTFHAGPLGILLSATALTAAWGFKSQPLVTMSALRPAPDLARGTPSGRPCAQRHTRSLLRAFRHCFCFPKRLASCYFPGMENRATLVLGGRGRSLSSPPSGLSWRERRPERGTGSSRLCCELASGLGQNSERQCA